MPDYVQPEVNKDAFHCPHCDSYSSQYLGSMCQNGQDHRDIADFYVIRCVRCDDVTIWEGEKMIFPSNSNAPLPNSDMPKQIKEDYHEARDLVTRSPRSACVLLRLCVEQICNEKMPGRDDLNEKIRKMVEQGLDSRIEKAMDSVRVIGGQAVHPLEMDLKDDTHTATALFRIVNHISEWAYTREREIDSIYDGLPDSKKNAIGKRDRKKQ